MEDPAGRRKCGDALCQRDDARPPSDETRADVLIHKRQPLNVLLMARVRTARHTRVFLIA